MKTDFTYRVKGSSFDIKAASLYSAVIHNDSQRLSYGIFNQKSGEIIETHAFGITSPNGFWRNTEVLEHIKACSKKTISFTGDLFSVVPESFFKVELLTEYLHFSSPNTEEYSILFEPITEAEIVFVYAIKKETIKKLKSKIGPFSIQHHFSSLLTCYYLYNVKAQKEQVFVQFLDHCFTITLFRNKKLIHFNLHSYTSAEDILYYVFYTLEQFNISREEAQIHFDGYSKFAQEIQNGAQMYATHIFHQQVVTGSIPILETPEIFSPLLIDITCG